MKRHSVVSGLRVTGNLQSFFRSFPRKAYGQKKRSVWDNVYGGFESVRKKKWVYIRLRVNLKKFLYELFPVNQSQSKVKRTSYQYCNGLSGCHKFQSLSFCIQPNTFSPDKTRKRHYREKILRCQRGN